jgi:hypothetical protein
MKKNLSIVKDSRELNTAPETQEVLQKQIKDCMQVLNTYGKKNFDYLPVLKVFIERLGSYNPKQIEEAFNKYIKYRSDFPTPADIISIIEGRIKPDSAVYNNLIRKRREGAFLSYEEEDYISKYEDQVFNEWGE